ncbi:MAG: CYTH domain-containing protein [Patescibacteria group bacterium]
MDLNKEIEVRFLEIHKLGLIEKLKNLGALDFGEALLEEVIFYDQKLDWLKENRFFRLRKYGESIRATYKEHHGRFIDGAHEIEFGIEDFNKAAVLFERIGLFPYRRQEKHRHSFKLNNVIIDIDTWPKIPAYVELEGPSEEALKVIARDLGFDWQEAVFDDARAIIEKRYKLPLGTMRWFTFERLE